MLAFYTRHRWLNIVRSLLLFLSMHTSKRILLPPHPCHIDNLIPPGSSHYGHSGILESACDLYEQIDGNPENKEFHQGGLLTSLLGPGCECEGYNLHVVGHSLGGAIVAMLGLKGITDDNLAGRKPPRQLGGMSDVLAVAADLGYSRYRPPPSQEDLRTGDDLIRLLSELNEVQRKATSLHVELQGRKVDMNISHLTHVSEMEKKIETLARITTILKGVIRNKDRIITRLQQPFPLEFIPVEAEYQKEFSELLRSAANDYGSLTTSVSDLHWTTNFREPPFIWKEMLRPIHVALMSCTRYFGAMSAMRESFETLQKLRVGPMNSPTSRYHSQRTSPAGSEHAGSEWSHEDLELRSLDMQGDEDREGEFGNDTDVDYLNGGRSSSEGTSS